MCGRRAPLGVKVLKGLSLEDWKMPAQKEESGGKCRLIRASMEAYRQSEFAGHVRGIQRELLLALRCLLDAGIERLTGKPSETPK